MIGNEIVVEVIAVSGDGVRLGISAPAQTSVHRYEVFVEIQEANRSAAVNETDDHVDALENLAAHIRPEQK